MEGLVGKIALDGKVINFEQVKAGMALALQGI